MDTGTGINNKKNEVTKLFRKLVLEQPMLFKIQGDKYLFKFKQEFENKTTKWVPINWDIIKNYALDHNMDSLLKSYINFRTSVVDMILDSIIVAEHCTPSCKRIATGSTSLTSDYDLVITGRLGGKIVRIFNYIFRNIFGNEAGRVFDTNVYGTAYMSQVTGDESLKAYEVLTSPNDNIKYKYVSVPDEPSNIKKEDVANQREGAFMKLFRYVASEDDDTNSKIKKDYK